MKLIMTLMVRDEADIIRSMIEHHLAHGVDKIIATDNGSIDGTYEILQSFGDSIDLRSDPIQRKQQFSVVTNMARDAHTLYGADWVINADADEFWLPRESNGSLHDIFSQLPTRLTTFKVPVVDMTGDPALRGSGLQRLTRRDTRSERRLHEIGLFSHSTPDAVHIGSPDIEVSQGNHNVNLTQNGDIPDGLELEVLHLPWRSWEQFETKVRNSGRAYDSNPALLPSPNHHGMREYARWKQGTLQPFYVLRHPDEHELLVGQQSGELQLDLRLAQTLTNSVADENLDPFVVSSARFYGPTLSTIETASRALAKRNLDREGELLQYIDEGKQRIDGLIEELRQANVREDALRDHIASTIEARLSRFAGRTKRALRGKNR